MLFLLHAFFLLACKLPNIDVWGLQQLLSVQLQDFLFVSRKGKNVLK